MNNIYYCTVSQTRGLSAEMPIGDPMGGPAYGKREMPIAIVALAAYSFAAGAAIATAAAATMTAMVVGGAMMAGAALTIVGTATGSKDLTKVGGILSLAGGVGALGASAAGGLTAGATEASAANGIADAATTGATDGAVQLSGPGMDGIADTATAGGAAPTITGVDATAPATGVDATPTTAGDIASNTAQPASDAVQQAAADANAAVDPSVSTFSTQSAGPTTPSANSAYQVTGNNDISGGLMGSGGTPPPAGSGTGGYFDKAGTWIRSNKELTKVGVDVLGGLLPTGKTQAETDYINAQTALSQQKLADDKRRALWSRGLIG